MDSNAAWSNETSSWSDHLLETVTNEQITAFITWWATMCVAALYWTQVYYTQFKIAGGASAMGGWSLSSDRFTSSYWEIAASFGLWINIFMTVFGVAAGMFGFTSAAAANQFIEFAGMMRLISALKYAAVGLFKLMEMTN
jgi:hypothetical protein